MLRKMAASNHLLSTLLGYRTKTKKSGRKTVSSAVALKPNVLRRFHESDGANSCILPVAAAGSSRRCRCYVGFLGGGDVTTVY